jgi:hypothetical protein
MIVERHVFHSDLGRDGGARLLRWCRDRGADAFTFTVIGTPPDLERDAAAIEAPLAPFQLAPTRIRAMPEGQPGSSWTSVSALWDLTDATEETLLQCFPEGLLTYLPTRSSWCEDPCVFRGDELMLGIISHEHEGVLRIHASEQLALDQADILYRLKGEWVGY